MKAIYRYYLDYDRHGSLEGIFLASERELKNLVGKELSFGEVLGKHSDVRDTFSMDNVEIVTVDPEVTRFFYMYDLSSGYNPLDYYKIEEM